MPPIRPFTRSNRALALLLATCPFVASAAVPAAAQTVPFGKNKVQYQAFDWHVLEGTSVDVYYYPAEEAIARVALAHAEAAFTNLERRFEHHPGDRIPLVVYASDRHFEQTNILPGFIPEGVLGFTEYMKGRIALPFRGDYAEFLHTLRHELVHFFQSSKIAETRRLHGRTEFSPQDVHWWTEGLAEYWSGAQSSEDDMYIRDRVVHGRLPSIPEFGRMRDFSAYPLGADLHAYLADRFGPDYALAVYESFWRYDSFDEALAGELGVDLDRLSREWQYSLERRHLPTYTRRPPLDVAAQRIPGAAGGRQPVVAPGTEDGETGVYYLSARTGYTNLYRTGLMGSDNEPDAVVEGGRSAEFESFHASESRIDVHSDGMLAFVSKFLGRDALYLWDTDRGRVVGRYQWPDLVGIRSPAWHPDGTRIVFEGLSTEGISDLYIVDLERQRRRALTRDRYRERDPDWSPDGRMIVFASDRTEYGEDGYTNLFLYELESDTLRYLTRGAWNDRDPRWSNAGDRIAFSSDRAGTYDLYTVDAEGRGHRVTALTGGAFAPDWLPDDRGLVFSGYWDGRFDLFRHDVPSEEARTPLVALAGSPAPPPPTADGQPAETAATAASGWAWAVPDSAALDGVTKRRYDTWRGLSVDIAGAEAVAAPGIGAAQGAQLLASDMLGDHIAFAGVSAIQAETLADVIDNFSGSALYLNLANRLNFGLGLYRFGGRYSDVGLDVYREERYGAYALVSYPFSTFRRLEVRLDLARSHQRDLDETPRFFAPIEDGGSDRDLSRRGMLATNSISYITDNTLWLATGPIDGQRLNLTAGLAACFECVRPDQSVADDVTRAAAAENYMLSLDYRRYLRTSLRSAYAVRLLGFVSDGLIPARAVLGGPRRLRGFPRYSLAGSRVWLINQEWRFPVLHGLAIATRFGTLRLPGVQGALFLDAGSSGIRGDRSAGPWGSYGIGLRMPLGQPLILRLDFGRRFRVGAAAPEIFDRAGAFRDPFVDFFFGYNY